MGVCDEFGKCELGVTVYELIVREALECEFFLFDFFVIYHTIKSLQPTSVHVLINHQRVSHKNIKNHLCPPAVW